MPETTVLYRQHERNVVGAKRRDWRRYIFGWGEFVERVRGRFDQSEAFEEHLRGKVAPELVSFLGEYNGRVRAGGLRNAVWIGRRGITMQSMMRTVALYLLLLKRGRFGRLTDVGQ